MTMFARVSDRRYRISLNVLMLFALAGVVGEIVRLIRGSNIFISLVGIAGAIEFVRFTWRARHSDQSALKLRNRLFGPVRFGHRPDDDAAGDRASILVGDRGASDSAP